eukprot:g6439.t1
MSAVLNPQEASAGPQTAHTVARCIKCSVSLEVLNDVSQDIPLQAKQVSEEDFEVIFYQRSRGNIEGAGGPTQQLARACSWGPRGREGAGGMLSGGSSLGLAKSEPLHFTTSGDHAQGSRSGAKGSQQQEPDRDEAVNRIERILALASGRSVLPQPSNVNALPIGVCDLCVTKVLNEGKRQCDALRKKLDAEEQNLKTELASLKQEESALEKEVESLDAELLSLSEKENTLFGGDNLALYQVQILDFEDEKNQIEALKSYTGRQLAILTQSSVLNDVFHISCDGAFGCSTGQTLELYGSEGAFARFYSGRRFDQAMCGFLSLVKQLAEYLHQRDATVRLPFRITDVKAREE